MEKVENQDWKMSRNKKLKKFDTMKKSRIVVLEGWDVKEESWTLGKGHMCCFPKKSLATKKLKDAELFEKVRKKGSAKVREWTKVKKSQKLKQSTSEVENLNVGEMEYKF